MDAIMIEIVKSASYVMTLQSTLTPQCISCLALSLCSVVMVVGAGRGPLVDASLRAARSSRRRIRVYAVEKNPGAVNT